FGGRACSAAGQEVPDGLLRRTAVPVATDGADRTQARRDRQSFEDARRDVGGHRPFGQARKSEPGDRRGPHVLRVTEVQLPAVLVRLTQPAPDRLSPRTLRTPSTVQPPR